VPTCRGVRPSLEEIFRTCEESARACVRQVPKPVERIITQSPFWRSGGQEEPRAAISKQPSLPATALGWGVPSNEVKGGREG